MTDVLLSSGYQIKTRWVIEGASTTWKWDKFFSLYSEAAENKKKMKDVTDGDWRLEIKIFKIELIADEEN